MRWIPDNRWSVSIALVLAAFILLESCAVPPAAVAGDPKVSGDGKQCEARGNLRFLCGAQRPEDVVRIPGTRWLVYSGFSDGAGLKLVDTAARSMRQLNYEVSGAHETGEWRDCRTPPDGATFNAQGLTLRYLGESQSRMYVVNHGGRESIEVFTINARSAEPRFA